MVCVHTALQCVYLNHETKETQWQHPMDHSKTHKKAKRAAAGANTSSVVASQDSSNLAKTVG
jgi:hypothetical protein